MVHVCVVPGCSNRSDRERNMSYYHLPLKNKKLLKVWVHKIGRKNLPLNSHSRVCSIHFENAQGRLLRLDEYPVARVPFITTKGCNPRKSPTKRAAAQFVEGDDLDSDDEPLVATKEVEVQTVESSTTDILQLQKQIIELKSKLDASQFRLSSIANNPQKVQYYTGFSNYATFKIFYDSLGPAVNCLNYWGSEIVGDAKSIRGRNRSLPPVEECFLVLVRLRLGLFEKDIAERFGISVSTVSRICITWLNFLYIKLRELPLWPKREIVQAYMPNIFKQLYSMTRVIIDATEIFVETPSLPELQQMTFSSYKNHNTYKALIGISPSGAITFVSQLFPGSISDKQLTRRSGLYDLLEAGDSVMADRGFDIQDDLTVLGVQLNMPPFLGRIKKEF